MTVVIRDINVKKRASSECFKNPPEMYTMPEYVEIAKKCICTFAEHSFAQSMLRDEDAISHVAEHLMIGHCRWKEDGGRTLRSYLNQCSIWAIQVWLTKVCEANAKSILSLNHSSTSFDSREQLYELVADKKAEEPFELLFNNNRVAAMELINSECLNETQRTCLEGRYIEGKSLQAIADGLGVTRQAVFQTVDKAIKILKNEYT